jgi:hypothetical protein
MAEKQRNIAEIKELVELIESVKNDEVRSILIKHLAAITAKEAMIEINGFKPVEYK